jgi:hypothetical protein
MIHDFSKVPGEDIQRSVFDRSHALKTAFDESYLYPILVDEIYPGDSFDCNMTGYARLSTPVYPIMDNLYLETFFFFVPMRLVWDNWEKFMGQQDNPADTTAYTIPQCTSGGAILNGYAEETLQDYMGLPIETTLDYSHSNIPMRMYNLIYNTWFKDQNLQNNVVVDTDNGPDTYSDYVLLKRGKRHDYFTACLPWTYKDNANTDVSIPLGTTAPILGIGKGNQTFNAGPISVYETNGSGTTSYANYAQFNSAVSNDNMYAEEDANNSGYPGIFADLANASGASVNQLRQSFAIQRLLELDARGGSRYNEIIRSHFGVSTAMDLVLQRPLYLGGGSTPIDINSVPQTSETGTTAQGNMAAYGTALAKNHKWSHSFDEHGYVIGLVNVRAEITYQQGIDRHWSRSDRYDFYHPSLNGIGEQAVLNKEIYAGESTDDSVFGYIGRFDELRYKNSRITGVFRSKHSASLDAWHLSEEFTSLPTLSATFIQDASPVSRVVAVTTEPRVILDTWFDYRCARPMPVYGIPGQMDRF